MLSVITDRLSAPADTTHIPRILVVDDEPKIVDIIARALSAVGYAIDFANDGPMGLALARTGDYGLVIIDLVMPELDGYTMLIRLMRERPQQPVLVLSCLADVTTKVRCLELGAHDYLTKPFSLDELVARVRVQLRGEGHARSEIMRTAGVALDTGRLQADSGHGPVALTRLEFLLLRELMENAGQAVAKERLLATVWGLDFDPGSNVVDVCVRRLRSKLGFELIRTVRGAGYQLAS